MFFNGGIVGLDVLQKLKVEVKTEGIVSTKFADEIDIEVLNKGDIGTVEA